VVVVKVTAVRILAYEGLRVKKMKRIVVKDYSNKPSALPTLRAPLVVIAVRWKYASGKQLGL
jgi:hypothetical protein